MRIRIHENTLYMAHNKFVTYLEHKEVEAQRMLESNSYTNI
jgi:hypothetical protein